MRLTWPLLALMTLGVTVPALASPLRVYDDFGGPLPERMQEVEALTQTGRPVEIRGRCYSSCTLYLGLDHVCLTPEARLGLHGPSWKGKPLGSRDFEHWSQIMAAAYREPLRSWFLNKGRYELTAMYQISGEQLIAMGYASCPQI